MKSEFAEYYRPSDADFGALGKNSIIAFDANALLNLYFYSDRTTQSVLAVMGLLKDRLWLPHQAGLEYQRNRLGVLAKVAKGNHAAKKTLLSIRSQIHARSQPPFLEVDLVQRYDSISDEIIATFEKASEDFIKKIHGVAQVADLDGDEVGFLAAKVAEIKSQR